MDWLIILGVTLIAAGFLAILLDSLYSILKTGEKTIRKGAIVMIGPLPIIYSDDLNTAKTLLLLTIILMALAMLLILTVRICPTIGM